MIAVGGRATRAASGEIVVMQLRAPITRPFYSTLLRIEHFAERLRPLSLHRFPRSSDVDSIRFNEQPSAIFCVFCS